MTRAGGFTPSPGLVFAALRRARRKTSSSRPRHFAVGGTPSDGAALDEADATDYTSDKEKNKVILEEGAQFMHSGSNTDTKTYPVTRLTLEGNATVDTSVKNVAIGRHYHNDYSHIDLGTNTLTVTGGKTFYISVCQISGTGTIDIQSGTTVASAQKYDTSDSVTTCKNGKICIREGAKWNLVKYQDDRKTQLSIKNLILDGSVTRAVDTFTLTVTGSITGNGTTPMLTMGSGAVFKPTGTGYLNITTSLSGTMDIDLGDIDLSVAKVRIPLFKVGSFEVLPAADEVQFVGGIPGGWHLEPSREGFGYDLVHSGFLIFFR